MIRGRPAWSNVFTPEAVQPVRPVPPLDDVTPEWAWGGSSGQGVKVAVIDSGIDAGLVYSTVPHNDVYGHGTACAGIIRGIAPACELYSIQVLGPSLTGRGIIFAA